MVPDLPVSSPAADDGGSSDHGATTVGTVSRRDRVQRRVRGNPNGSSDRATFPAEHEPVGSSGTPGPSLREQVERASPAARALLLIRAFFGITFIYAGLDKLVDPAFFNAADPGSIASQLTAFTHVSPLAPLITLAEPFAIPLGFLIAIAEIAIGLGALTGLAYRLAAAGGAILSLMFWLTASWTTHPYYYGADLPYAAGWLALLIAGHGNLLVPRIVREMGAERMDDWDRARAGLRGGTRPRDIVPGPSAARRLVLQAGVLGAAALALASLAVPLQLFRGDRSGGDGIASGDGATARGAGATTAGGDAATSRPVDPSPEESPEVPSDDPTASTQFAPSGLMVASLASVDSKGAVRIRVPANAPSSLPAGDPGIIVKLPDGTYAAYDALCTHEGCKVGWDPQDSILLCPCHGAAFDPADHGAVLGGPTSTPLFELPIVIDHQAGTITLQA